MRSVLLVSPHFPPINAPDHQRVRMALGYLEEFGWKPTILAVEPDAVEGVRDELLARTLPANTEIVRTSAWPVRHTRKLGFGSLAIRAYASLRRAGRRLLATRKFDAVFFSTTQFPVMAIGRGWRKRFGVPYVLDFQDPWLSDYYHKSGVQPPGGHFKYGLARLQARFLEPYALRCTEHIVSVSPAYVSMLNARYRWLKSNRFTVLPFGAPEKDFALLRDLPVEQKVFDPEDGKIHFVYAGVFIEQMHRALRGLFTALVRLLGEEPELKAKLQMHFIGTSYAPRELARKGVEPLAHEFGFGDIVKEVTDRQPYFETLKCLQDADALLVPGSDDPSYTASKIYPYILAKKPMLAIFHEQSSVVDILTKTKAGTVVSFKSGETPNAIADRIVDSRWLDAVLKGSDFVPPATDWSAFEPYTAREMTRKLCAVFDSVCNGRQ